MNKKILYIDMDGVVANFDKAIKYIDPSLEVGDNYPNYKERSKRVDEILMENPHIFLNLEPIDGAILHIKMLMKHFDVYFLSTPCSCVPESFTDKRLWLTKHFGEESQKRLILTHRKDLNIGDYLVDDRFTNGAGEFRGKLLPFGSPKYPSWVEVFNFLIDNK